MALVAILDVGPRQKWKCTLEDSQTINVYIDTINDDERSENNMYSYELMKRVLKRFIDPACL